MQYHATVSYTSNNELHRFFMTNDNKNSKHIINENQSSFFNRSAKPEMVLHFLVMAACTVVLLAGVKTASGIFAPLLLALFVTIILLVPLRWLQSKGISSLVSLIVVLGCTIVLFLGIAWLVGSSLNDFLRELPQYNRKIMAEYAKLEKMVDGFALGLNLNENPKSGNEANETNPAAAPGENPEQTDPEAKESPKSIPLSRTETEQPVKPAEDSPDANKAIDTDENEENAKNEKVEDDLDQQKVDEIINQAKQGTEPPFDFDMKNVMYWVTKSVLELKHLAEKGFLVLIFTLFMIFEAARFPAKVDRAFGKGPITNEHFHRIAMEIRRYLFLKAISSMMSAVAATAVYLFFGVPGALMWGVIAFFLYFIPNIGGIVASIIPGLLIFMNLGVPGVLCYSVCLVTIECTIGYGIEPRILGHGLGISTVVIFLSLIMWGWILGPIGLFLAAPLTIMVKIILQAFKETEWIAILLGDNSPHSRQS